MVTIREIAKAVGVSSATVSRVLNSDATLSVSPQTRQKVLETAEALNYATPRNRKRAAQGGLAKIALVHFLAPEQELIDPYYVGLRLGIERRCQALGVEVVKVYHSNTPPRAATLQSCSGVIAVGVQSAEDLDWITRFGKALVFADWGPEDGGFDMVLSDLEAATRSLLRDLTEMDYRRIGFIGWAEEGHDDPLSERRCAAYLDWMRREGRLDPALCATELSEDRQREATGHRLAREMLTQPEPPDALIACNDNVAIGIYRAIHEMGLRIPEDVAVVSFNDVPSAQFLNPPLSTVHLPAEEIGETAVDLLAERLAGREVAKRVTLGTRTIWRASTRRMTRRKAV